MSLLDKRWSQRNAPILPRRSASDFLCCAERGGLHLRLLIHAYSSFSSGAAFDLCFILEWTRSILYVVALLLSLLRMAAVTVFAGDFRVLPRTSCHYAPVLTRLNRIFVLFPGRLSFPWPCESFSFNCCDVRVPHSCYFRTWHRTTCIGLNSVSTASDYRTFLPMEFVHSVAC